MFINTLEKIYVIMNEDFIMKILYKYIITKVQNTLQKEYEALVYYFKVKLDNESVFTLNKLKEKLRSKYHPIKKYERRHS